MWSNDLRRGELFTRKYVMPAAILVLAAILCIGPASCSGPDAGAASPSPAATVLPAPGDEKALTLDSLPFPAAAHQPSASTVLQLHGAQYSLGLPSQLVEVDGQSAIFTPQAGPAFQNLAFAIYEFALPSTTESFSIAV